MDVPILEVRDVAFGYRTQQVLNNISFNLYEGEVVSLIGGSGMGKTTLLKVLSGILPAQHGVVKTKDNQIAFMMQQDVLLPWRTVLGNVLLAGEIGATSSVQDAMQLLDAVHLTEYKDFFPDALSAGMRQRVALARVLMLQRPILLLDEPFAALDVLLREQLYHLLRHLCSQKKIAVFLVTHDFRDALVLSDRIMCLSGGTISQEWNIPAEVHQDSAAIGIWQEKLKQSLRVEKWT